MVLALLTVVVARPAMALPVAAPDPNAKPAVAPTPSSAAPFVLVRRTVHGTVLGALAGSTPVAALRLFGCSLMASHSSDHFCNSRSSFLLTATIWGGMGAWLGANIGAATPGRKPASYTAGWWERADGEIGGAFLHLGGNRFLAREGASLSPAVRAGFLVQLGPFFAFGPEVGAYGQRAPAGAAPVGAAEQREPAIDETAVAVAVAARVVIPTGGISSYLLASYGRLSVLEGTVEDRTLGAGAEWRLFPRLGVGAETRWHSLPGRTPRAFVDLTLGTTVHW